jgi:transcriptional regulator with XRE-family HTH domain
MKSENMTRFRDMMIFYRKGNNLSYRALSVLTGIDASALYRFEQGKPLHETQMSSIFRWLLGCVDNDKDRTLLQKAKDKKK